MLALEPTTNPWLQTKNMVNLTQSVSSIGTYDVCSASATCRKFPCVGIAHSSVRLTLAASVHAACKEIFQIWSHRCKEYIASALLWNLSNTQGSVGFSISYAFTEFPQRLHASAH